VKTRATNGWLESLEDVLDHVLEDESPQRTTAFLEGLTQRLCAAGVEVPRVVNTPYVNTIPRSEQPEYPGDRETERRINSCIRWNAMAMVVNANEHHSGIGGHISTYASQATLYEVGFNHFFRGPDGKEPADMIYFQGHATPGNYARAFLEGRLTAEHLEKFRRELAGGVPSYPHPHLMPEFWQFPTVSMGLGPIQSIYQARFNRYLIARGFLKKDAAPRVWAFVGDGEMDEPEAIAGLTLAARERLDNLTWVVNCNLQRLDGPVRGNGKIIQELEALFRGAGTSYASHGIPMVPFYMFYSMFGFQRTGDLAWAAGDMKARGFLLGATAGRTTLNGEGLQHQDGHSHVLASTYPTLLAYDPAFAYEIAVIVADGLRRMFAEGEDVFYYLTLHNENYAMPAKPEGAEQGILKGLYKFRAGPSHPQHKAHIFGSGALLREALRAQEILGERYDVSADVWSATSYKMLRTDALRCGRWNMLHPTAEPRRSYVEQILENERGVFLAVSDFMKLVPDQIAPWVPGGLTTLGTDGFGRSDTRAALRRFFEVDAEVTVTATLHALARRGEVNGEFVAKAIGELGVDPEKACPEIV
jgi:pyruvate dehydrogenase complex dehydrogenase (E1) component